jgi:hypothetical protein
MPFLVVQPLHQPLHPPTYYASLGSGEAWRIVPPGGTRPVWSAVDLDPITVPLHNAGQGYLDAAGQFWLYARYTTGGASYAATYDFATDRAVPAWTVTGATGVGGLVSAAPDGLGGFYGIALGGGPNWIIHYSGSGSAATSATPSDSDWEHAWDVGVSGILPFYGNGNAWALWQLGGTWYAWVVGEYSAVWTGGGHAFIASLWTCAGDPSDAGSWTFFQYLSHWDMGATSFKAYWGELEEELLPWITPQVLPLLPTGVELYFGTGMNIIDGTGDPPNNTTVVWRLYPGDPPSPDLAMPMPGTDMETWGGPLAVYAGELYWAQFTHPHNADWIADSGTITLWRRRLGGWTVVSTYTHALYHTFYHPMIATMIPSATGLWLLFSPTGFWTTGDPTPRIFAWAEHTDTWSVAASTTGGGNQATPRIWPRYTP